MRDAIFAASDGMVTTFAVVAGSRGASLSSAVVLILGFANLFADGISMSAGTYLGVKSEEEYEEAKKDKHPPDGSPLKQALVTFLAFGLAGFIPLIPYVLGFEKKFEASLLSVFVTLFCVGVVRARFVKKHWLRSGFELSIIGGFAAVVAYVTGYLLDRLIA